MSRSQSEQLIGQIVPLAADYQEETNKYFADAARVRDDILAGMQIPQGDSASFNAAVRAAGERALLEVPKPLVSERLLGLGDDLAYVVHGDIYHLGVTEAPDLSTAENIEGFDNAASIVGASAAAALFQRLNDGRSTLSETLKDVEALRGKGYDKPLLQAFQAEIRTINPEIKYIPDDVKGAMIHRVLIDEKLRNRMVDEMYVEPPTEKGMEIAAIFIEHPRVVRNVPQPTLAGLVGGRKDWMERAAELQPQLAIEHQNELFDRGFKEAVRQARTELREQREEKQSGLILFDESQESEVASQDLPDARTGKTPFRA